jgi:hypothetical protein
MLADVRPAVEMLRSEHAETLARFRIPHVMLKAAGVRSVSDREAREMFGLQSHQEADLSGILYPYLSPLTGSRVGGRIRLDHRLPGDGGKYISEPGCRHLFFAPFPKEWLADTSIPVVLVESEKAALALLALAERAERKLVSVALGGCWGWRRKIGKKPDPDGGFSDEKGASPDFDLILWQGREAIVCSDSNASTNVDVQKARRALQKELSQRGARVKFAEVPPIKNVNGPDDLIAVSGDEAMLRVLDHARITVITLLRGAMPSALDDAEDVLVAHSERLGIFQRAGELVRVVSLPEPSNSGGLRRPMGTVQHIQLTQLALSEIFDRSVQWQRIGRNGDLYFVDCPDKVAASYLSRVGSWRVPVLKGLISAPIMRKDGTILAEAGYDKATGLFLESDRSWPAIPDRPTRQDAEAALKALMNPFEEFPFVAAEDFVVHVAAILTAIQRRILGPCPIFGYSAPVYRSGKSLLADSVAIIATGIPAPATAVSWQREEMRKAVASILREGHSITNLDNITFPLESPDLAMALTQTEYQDRLLGRNRMLRLATNVTWTATGNNLCFGRDLSSRALNCRIDPGEERPEARTFKIPDLEDFLKRNREELVTAALTILRAYQVAGRPRQQVQPWGGFGNWSESIREPLIWTGLADPCRTRETVLWDDPEREGFLVLLQSLRETFGDDIFTTKEIVDRCTADDTLRNSTLSVAGGRHNGDGIDHNRLGWWCRRVHHRVIGGLRLDRAGILSNVAQWRIADVAAGGSGGFGGHLPAVDDRNPPRNGSWDRRGAGKYAGQPENDPQNPDDHLAEDHEAGAFDEGDL